MPFWAGGSNRRGHSGNGLPNKRPSKFHAGLIAMSSAEYERDRQKGRRANAKWRGSTEEKEIRGGTWFGWGKKR